MAFTDNDGKRGSKSFAKKTDANRFVKQVEAELLTDTFEPVNKDGKLTVNAWADRYIGYLTLKPKTVAGYESTINKHVRPRLGHKPVSAITRNDARQLVADMHADGLARQTVKGALTMLGAILECAVDAGAVPANAARGVKLPDAGVRPERAFTSPEQVLALANAVGERYACAVRLARQSGLRAGELWALTVGDVRPDLGYIEVCRAVSEVHGKLDTSSPKHGKTRKVHLSASMCDELELVTFGRAAAELLFTTESGTQVRQSNFYRRHFKPARAACDLPSNLTFHSLRHGAASQMLALNLPILSVSEQLGHSSIDVTVDIYGHLFPSSFDDLRIALDSVY